MKKNVGNLDKWIRIVIGSRPFEPVVYYSGRMALDRIAGSSADRDRVH